MGAHVVSRRFQDKTLEACLRGFTESRPQRGDWGAPHRWTGQVRVSWAEGTAGTKARGLRESVVPSKSLSVEQGCQYLPGSLMNVGMERDLSVLLPLDEEMEGFLCSGK